MKTPVIAAGVMSLVAGMVYSVPAINASTTVENIPGLVSADTFNADPLTPPPVGTSSQTIFSTTEGRIFPGWSNPLHHKRTENGCIRKYTTTKTISPVKAIQKYAKQYGSIQNTFWDFGVKYGDSEFGTDRETRATPPLALKYEEDFCQLFYPGLKPSMTPDYGKIGVQLSFTVKDRKTYKLLYSHSGKPIPLTQIALKSKKSKSKSFYFDGHINYKSFLTCESTGEPRAYDMKQNRRLGGKWIQGLVAANECFFDVTVNFKSYEMRKMVHMNSTVVGIKFVPLSRKNPVKVSKYFPPVSKMTILGGSQFVSDLKELMLIDESTGKFYIPPNGYVGTGYDIVTPPVFVPKYAANSYYQLNYPFNNNSGYTDWRPASKAYKDLKFYIASYWEQYDKYISLFIQQFNDTSTVSLSDIKPSWLPSTVCAPWIIRHLIGKNDYVKASLLAASCDNLIGNSTLFKLVSYTYHSQFNNYLSLSSFSSSGLRQTSSQWKQYNPYFYQDYMGYVSSWNTIVSEWSYGDPYGISRDFLDEYVSFNINEYVSAASQYVSTPNPPPDLKYTVCTPWAIKGLYNSGFKTQSIDVANSCFIHTGVTTFDEYATLYENTL